MSWILEKVNYFVILLFMVFVSTRVVLAEETTLGVASMINVESPNTFDGGLLCGSGNKYVLCESESDSNLIGVISSVPAAVFGSEVLTEGDVPVVNTGRAIVMVSTENGNILKGDYVTTSSKHKGVGVKAIKSGYVLGIAQVSYANNDKNIYGKIPVSLGIKPAVLTTSARGNLIELIKQGFDSAFLTPLSSLRYVVAALLVIGSVVFSFVNFGKVAKKGVEAVGRNPLASKAINLSVLLNVILTIVFVLVGLYISYLILTL